MVDGMETEQSSQHQHAQWLASLATEHFVQQSLNSVAKESGHQREKSEAAEEEDSHIVDMSRHAVVKLAVDATDGETSSPEASATGSPFNLRKNLKKRKIENDEPEGQEFKLIRQKERASAKGFDMRRPVRPIDRQKMRPWLKNLLDTGSVFGLNWLQREEGIFQISWRHASRLGWNLETDGDVFERWARHTGIFKDGDEPEPKRWKANFRCALHSLPDVKELTSPTDRKGRNASRTYRLLRPNEVQPPVKRKQRYNIQIPFAVYEIQGSEDSGSPHADSDERNSEEEPVVAEKILAFPLCDHDYAIRWEKPADKHGEQTSAEMLSKQNSGYVLIKSKDAHEIEFRLTPPQSVQSSGSKRAIAASKSSSAQKKGKANKKKPASTSPVKKSISKAGQNSPTKKDGTKRMKKSGEKSGETSPATKVSLKALLSGRKNAAGAKKSKGGQMASTSSKNVKRLQKPASPKIRRNSKTQGLNIRMSSCQQPQGLDVLLEAANQIEGMSKTRTSPSPTVPTPTPSQTFSRRSPRPKVAASQTAPKPSPQPPQKLSAQLSQNPSPACSKTVPTSQFIVPNVGTPIVLTPHPMVGGKTTGAATFTSIPVLASVQAAGPPAPAQSQVSLSVLQKFLSTVQNFPPPTSKPMTLGQVMTGPLVTTNCRPQVKRSLKLVDQRPAQVVYRPAIQKPIDQTLPCKMVEIPQKVRGVPPVPTLVTQPEGTSMLKHLLRLTGPSMNFSTIPIHTVVATSTASPTISALPQVITSTLNKVTTAAPHTVSTLQSLSTPSLSQLFTAAGRTMKEASAAEQSVLKIQIENGSVGHAVVTGENSVVDSVNQSRQIKRGFPMKALATQSGVNSTSAVKQGNSSQSLGKPLLLKTEERAGGSHTASHSSFSVPVSSMGTRVTCDSDGLRSSGAGQPCAAPQPVTPATVCFTQARAPRQLTASSVPQVTLCLPQAELGPQTQQVSSQGAQTVTLAQSAEPTLPGHTQESSLATFTHSMDFLQFLNLCAASGNGQVIIKAEPPPPAASNVHVSDQAAMASQGRGKTSAVPSYTVVDACEKVNSTDTVVLRGSLQSNGSEQRALASALHTASLAAVRSPASTVAAESPALLPTMDSASLSATTHTSALSAAVQSLNSLDSSTFSATMVHPSALSAALQSSALSTSMDCPGALSSAETQPDLATALTVVSASRQPLVSVTVPAVQGTPAEMGLSGGHGTVTHQFVDEPNLVAVLSTDQHGADSFIVDDMLL